MPRFLPLEPPAALPQLGTAAEHALWDLKQWISNQAFHNAKDVAAFANHFGGTLLIGAEERAGTVGRYHARPVADIASAENQIAAHVRARCSPVPAFNFARFQHGADWVLAVNVWPVISTLVAVRVRGDRQDGYGDDAWVFPTRLANHSNTIEPEALPMYMLPELRRKLLLLYAIPPGTRLDVRVNNQNVSVDARLVDINERENFMVLARDPMRLNQVDRYPLDAVTHVYKFAEEPNVIWRVQIQF